MSFRTALLAVCAALPIAAHAAPAAPLPLALNGFELRETGQWTISVTPADRLTRGAEHPNRGTDQASYRFGPEGVTLTSEARKPTAYHARQPRTEMSESRHWRIVDGRTDLSAALRIDRRPARGAMILAELSSDDDAAPILSVVTEGDRVLLRGPGIASPSEAVALGTIGPDHGVRLLLAFSPDGEAKAVVNGTTSRFSLTPEARMTPVAFRTGAHAIDDIGTSPDRVTVTLTGLGAHHAGAVARTDAQTGAQTDAQTGAGAASGPRT
ncbi:hypothetical protein [Swaminathania salitolerans]|uniref:Alginate lyase 2 domain-containing protein n=1 Tax=Swaminathania salitolerans TaxID=182838 RepID=A0A511BKP7_9PROT|nr:hypothetical protein [Swaminathania salitolerans]GBQ09543.1 hypothetical protein AA21291_0114 [Swaminathania salitolerans LMG 21291]GEL00929.1 hypothetical protein SSA02_00920 [Swaminathania salitolerans]